MHNVQNACSMTESNIEHIVFTAARANEIRSPKFGVFGYNVRFIRVSSAGEFQAIVSDANGFDVGYAIVDEMDI